MEELVCRPTRCLRPQNLVFAFRNPIHLSLGANWPYIDNDAERTPSRSWHWAQQTLPRAKHSRSMFKTRVSTHQRRQRWVCSSRGIYCLSVNSTQQFQPFRSPRAGALDDKFLAAFYTTFKHLNHFLLCDAGHVVRVATRETQAAVPDLTDITNTSSSSHAEPAAAASGGCPFLAALPAPPPAQHNWWTRLLQLKDPPVFQAAALGPHKVVQAGSELGLPAQIVSK